MKLSSRIILSVMPGTHYSLEGSTMSPNHPPPPHPHTHTHNRPTLTSIKLSRLVTQRKLNMRINI